MKSMKVKNALWLQNYTVMDVSVDDLGVVIKSGATVNVYKHNPALTEEQVQKSLDSGSISRRLKTKTLKIVKKAVGIRPFVLDKIKQSDKPMLITQIKSSIIITPESLLLGDDQKEKFEFADYGVSVEESARLLPTPPPPPPVLPVPPATKNVDGSVTIGEVSQTRSLKSIVAGTQKENMIQDDQDGADKIIKVETKILDENGKETGVEAIKTEEKVTVMQTV